MPSPTDRFGGQAVLLSATSNVQGAKVAVTLASELPASLETIGIWVDPVANVDSAGFQVEDAEGEMLLLTHPIEDNRWQEMSFDLSDNAFAPAYPQPDKNGRLDPPLRSLRFVWFTKTTGKTSLALDGCTGTVTDTAQNDGQISIILRPMGAMDAGTRASATIEIINYTDEEQKVDFDYILSGDSTLSSPVPPNTELGDDEALGKPSWTLHKGERVSEGTLTDGDDMTAYGFHWGANIDEASQVVDFGEAIAIRQIQADPSDANWIYKVDILVSDDGETFSPVAGLQGLDWNRKWGPQTLVLEEPLTTRFFKLRYHNNGATMTVLKLPHTLSVYDGPDDDSFALPEVDEPLEQGTVTAKVPARGVAVATITSREPLASGCYLFAVRRTDSGSHWLTWQTLLSLPPPMDKISPDSPFGINASRPELVTRNRQLGVGWVRFENIKWPMVSPAPGQFNFTGAVAPWHVDVDAYLKANRDAGISVIPFLYETPDWESTAADGVTKNRHHYPPQSNERYAEFVFQTVARYGSRKHPAADLLTEDKVSGLGWVDTYEIWNEPDLHNPDWGAWVGSYEQYLEMFRLAALAVKQADPNARVSHGGHADSAIEQIEPLRTYTYTDGTHPLDYVDILNVHHYTGPVAPEIATVNTNTDRSGNTQGAMSFEEILVALKDWRDRYKPGTPIWMSETGFDTGGPRKVSIRNQAAYTPRNLLTVLGHGIDKVFVYREKGSTPSLYAASGMLDNEDQPRPSFLTYATLIRVMDGAEGFVRLLSANENIRIYGAVKNGEPILAAWSITETEPLGISLGTVRTIDAFGYEKATKVDSNYPLTIFPTYFEGIDKDKVRSLFVEAQQ